MTTYVNGVATWSGSTPVHEVFDPLLLPLLLICGLIAVLFLHVAYRIWRFKYDYVEVGRKDRIIYYQHRTKPNKRLWTEETVGKAIDRDWLTGKKDKL